MSTSSPDAGDSPGPDRPDLPPAHGPAPPRNGLGVAALALGVIGVLTFWLLIGGILFGLAAAITGGFAVGRVHRGRATNRGVALGGVATGVLAVVASVVFLLSGLSSLYGIPV